MSKSEFKSTVDIVKIAVMAVLVFLATYLVKIPLGSGYIHIGDSIIFFSVYLLGVRKGALVGAIGATLADIFGGYFLYFIPTFIIKSIMAIIIGILSLKIFKNNKYRFIIGTTIAGIFQIIAYTFVNYFINGKAGLFTSILGDIIQVMVSIILFLIIIFVIEKLNLNKILRK